MTTPSKETTKKTKTSDLVLLFGDPSKDFLQITVFRRTYPDADDFWDGNWLDCQVKLVASPFQTEYACTLRTEDFAHFRVELRHFPKEMDDVTRFARFEAGNKPHFESIEPWIKIQMGTNGNGYFVLNAELKDTLRSPHTLSMGLQFTADDVPQYLSQLDAIVEAFPIINKRSPRPTAPSSNG